MSFFKDLNNKLNESLYEGKKEEEVKAEECDKDVEVNEADDTFKLRLKCLEDFGNFKEGKIYKGFDFTNAQYRVVDEDHKVVTMNKRWFKEVKNEGVEEVAPGNVEEVDESLEGFEAITESMSIYVCNECGELCEAEGVCPECNEGVLEEAMKVVVRDGKVMKKKVGKKKRLSAKQKAALAKARKKAHTGAAQKARAKSMKVRAKKVHEGEDFACPECGYEGAMDNIEPDVWECPDCGAELMLDESVNEEVSESVQAKVDEYLDLLEVPESVMYEGYQACIDYLSSEFGIVIE